MERIKAPEKWQKEAYEKGQKRYLFIAGSIEMGKASEWQNELCEMLADLEKLVVLDPRRDNWDSSWEQTVDNPNFLEQVTWELDSLEGADIVSFYFDPDTKSPITLLELGLSAKNVHCVVCCPPGFYRRGNVEIVCNRESIVLVGTLEELSKKIRDFFEMDSESYKHEIK